MDSVSAVSESGQRELFAVKAREMSRGDAEQRSLVSLVHAGVKPHKDEEWATSQIKQNG